MNRDKQRAILRANAGESFALMSEPATVRVWKTLRVDGYKDRQPELFVDRMGHPAQGLLFGDVQPGLAGR